MSDSYESINYAEFEARARALRAEAAREGVASIAKALSNLFTGFFARTAKHA